MRIECATKEQRWICSASRNILTAQGIRQVDGSTPGSIALGCAPNQSLQSTFVDHSQPDTAGCADPLELEKDINDTMDETAWVLFIS